MRSIGDCYDNAMTEAFWGINANRAYEPQAVYDAHPSWPTPIFVTSRSSTTANGATPAWACALPRVRTVIPTRPTRNLETAYGDTAEPGAHYLRTPGGGPMCPKLNVRATDGNARHQGPPRDGPPFHQNGPFDQQETHNRTLWTNATAECLLSELRR